MGNIINEVNKVIGSYTAGKSTLEETNIALGDLGSDLRLNPGKNELTEAEIEETIVGETPSEANGMGLLDTGTGTLDKVYVEDGELVDNDVGEMYALCIIGGKVYHVEGNTLTE